MILVVFFMIYNVFVMLVIEYYIIVGLRCELLFRVVLLMFGIIIFGIVIFVFVFFVMELCIFYMILIIICFMLMFFILWVLWRLCIYVDYDIFKIIIEIFVLFDFLSKNKMVVFFIVLIVLVIVLKIILDVFSFVLFNF